MISSAAASTSDDLLARVSDLMREQQAAYVRLEKLARNLTAQLVNGSPETIQRTIKIGNIELFKMRARLVEMMNTLTAFADARRNQTSTNQTATTQPPPLTPEARSDFEAASKKLLEAARSFARLSQQLAALARNGSSFTSANIEFCGIQPSTYRAPYAPGVRQQQQQQQQHGERDAVET